MKQISYLFFVLVTSIVLCFAFTAKNNFTDDDLVKLTQEVNLLQKVNDKPQYMMPTISMLCIAPTTKDGNGGILFPHENNFINVYVNKTAFSEMTEKKRPKFPVGSVIIKEKFVYADTAFASPILYTLMIKHEKGYNPSCGDWEFATVEPLNENKLTRGKMEQCMNCHKNYTERDFIFRTNYIADRFKLGMK